MCPTHWKRRCAARPKVAGEWTARKAGRIRRGPVTFSRSGPGRIADNLRGLGIISPLGLALALLACLIAGCSDSRFGTSARTTGNREEPEVVARDFAPEDIDRRSATDRVGADHGQDSHPAAVASGRRRRTSARKRLVMVCSTTQCADFARQIVGDRWTVHCVLGAGQDPHGYEPRVSDADLVATADLCVQNGWNLEGHAWMRRLAENAGRPLVTCVADVQPLMIEQEHPVQDPHAWFDPANAWKYVKQIRDGVIRIDPEHADAYRTRADLYRRQLRQLEFWIEQQVNAIPEPRILVTHHDAFGYFCRRFRFQATSPVGWTTDEIAGTSIADRQAVLRQIRRLGVKCIFVESSLNHAMVEAIAKEAGIRIGGELYSDAMGPPGSAGETYIGMMRENTLTIVRGLR